ARGDCAEEHSAGISLHVVGFGAADDVLDSARRASRDAAKEAAGECAADHRFPVAAILGDLPGRALPPGADSADQGEVLLPALMKSKAIDISIPVFPGMTVYPGECETVREFHLTP